MRIYKILFFLIIVFCCASTCSAEAGSPSHKKRLIIIDSYHKGYGWTEATHSGVTAALLEFGYFSNQAQVVEFLQHDYVETANVIVKRRWMNSKKKEGKDDLIKITFQLTREIEEFSPDLILLGDDNAANYIGNTFLDTSIPVVFWGMNQSPLKYGLLENINWPGHNVTGVYQTGYFKDAFDLLKTIVPDAETFSILSDDSPTGRSGYKALEHMARSGELPLKHVVTVVTNDFEKWKTKALELQEKSDAFFLTIYATLKDKNGNHVPAEEVAKWYLTNITIPEITVGAHFVKHGLFCAVDDSGFNQGYEAIAMARDILEGVDPAVISPRVPKRGDRVVNKQRANILGIKLGSDMGIERTIDQASALTVKKLKRIAVVSSYHREYPSSLLKQAGINDAMLDYGYFDNKSQGVQYFDNDSVQTSKVIVRKFWMDSKRKSSIAEREEISLKIFQKISSFSPDLILLGDDNAARFVGGKFLDSSIPVVFWGVNNTPLKYGLVDSMDKPGHNITGVYQTGYYLESLQLLKKIVPSIKTFAILSDATPTGRSHYKEIQYLARHGDLPLELVDTVATNDFITWQKKALALQSKVDAFFLAQYSGLKDGEGNYVPTEEVAQWYTEHISIPETVGFVQLVKQGMLCGADDSSYNQAYEAVTIAHDLLSKHGSPASYPPRTPKRGKLIVNRQRAKQLGIILKEDMGIESFL